jgi:hypothetical protein
MIRGWSTMLPALKSSCLAIVQGSVTQMARSVADLVPGLDHSPACGAHF